MIIKKRLNHKILVPEVERIAREMTASSQIMIIVKRALALPLPALGQLVLNNLKYLPALAGKDFAVGIKLLAELKILAEPRRKDWVLHPQMTDMAVAFKNKRVLEEFFRLAKRYGFAPGLASNNLGPLIRMLARLPKLPESLLIYGPLRKEPIGVKRYLKQSRLEFVEIGSK